jgi:hypothetical protein
MTQLFEENRIVCYLDTLREHTYVKANLGRKNGNPIALLCFLPNLAGTDKPKINPPKKGYLVPFLRSLA